MPGQETISAVLSATVPTGTTGDIVINLDGTINQTSISVYVIDGLTSNASADTAGSAAAIPSIILTATKAANCIIAGYGHEDGSISVSWTGVTEDTEGGTNQTMSSGNAVSISIGDRTVSVGGAAGKEAISGVLWEK